MVDKKAQRKWYFPVLIAERANDSFLGIVRSTGAAVRHVEKGASRGASSVRRVLEDTAAPSRKAPAGRQHRARVANAASEKVAVVLSREVCPPVPARRADAHEQPLAAVVTAPAPPTPAVPDAPTQAATPGVVIAANASAHAVKVPEPKASEPKAPELGQPGPRTAEQPAIRWWRRARGATAGPATAVEERRPAPQATTPQRARPPETRLPGAATTVDEWLASLVLRYRSQRVQLRSAVDDLLHGSDVARASAARALEALGRGAEAILVDCAYSTSPAVVEACLESLVNIGSRKLPQLLPRIASAEDHKLRLVALRVARHLDDAARKPLLVAALRDPHPILRRRVLTYVSWERAAWAKGEVLRLCYDPDPTVRWAALEALAAVHPEEARMRLDGMFPGMDAALRRHAVRLLERHQWPVEADQQALH